MAGNSQSATSARSRRATQDRQTRLVITGALIGLGVVVAIIAVGLFVTQYRAPRRHVLTVGEREYDAAAVARRGSYYVLTERGAVDIAGIAAAAVELLVNEAVTRERAPATVGALEEGELEAELRSRFGLTPEDDAVAYAEALTQSLRASGLSRDEYFELVEAGMLAARLDADFRSQVGNAALQLRLSRIRFVDRELAEEVRALAVASGDFAALALKYSTDTAQGEDGGDLGWSPLELMEPEVAALVETLQAGEVAPLATAGIFFDLYLVSERDEERALEFVQINQLVQRRLEAWLNAERLDFTFELGLSDGEESWIRDRVVSDVNRALGR